MSVEHLTWEYLVEAELAFEELNELGKAGWELICVTDGNYFLKRPRLSFRERVTLEQRSKYYAGREQHGQESGAAS